MTTGFLLAAVRDSIADYVQALVTVYWLIILAYILFGWIQMFGARIPYSRPTSALIGFVTEASEPYLGLFRRYIKPIGGLDLSPIIAILVLVVAGNLLAGLIRG